VAIPRLGFEIYRMPGVDASSVVESTLGVGYRHIDTAAVYQSEETVGSAIGASGLGRADLFVMTKVPHDRLGTRDTVFAAFDTSLAKLGHDFIDLFKVHWPSRARAIWCLQSQPANGASRP